jgi:putative Holliday junction resolvase
MLTFNPAVLVAALPHKGPLMSLDIGSRTFGIAVCDSAWQVVSPLKTLRRQRWRHDLLLLQQLWEQQQTAGLVIGWPLNMDGTRGARCHSTHHVAENIQTVCALPCLFWDERLTTQEAKHTMRADAAFGMTRKQRSLDCIAASLILEDALRALNGFPKS